MEDLWSPAVVVELDTRRRQRVIDTCAMQTYLAVGRERPQRFQRSLRGTLEASTATFPPTAAFARCGAAPRSSAQRRRHS